MGLEFLVRVRRTSALAGAVLALFGATYLTPVAGLAMVAGTVWSLVNLFLIEKLIVTLTGPYRGTTRGLRDAAFAIGGQVVLFAAGAFLLTRLPIPQLLWGFFVPLVVIVLKSVSTLLVESRLWRALVASPWRAALVVASILVAAWWVVPAVVQGQDATHHEPAPAAAAHAESADHGAAQGPQKFANVITILSRAFPNAGWAHFLHQYEAVIFALLVAAILSLIVFLASRNPQMIPGRLQNLVEMLVEGLYNFIAGIIGEKHAARFVPFLGTLGLYIWFMNVFGLIPFMDSPTSNLNVTFALGLVVFVYAQWIGLRGLGPVGYVDHLLGQPRDLTGWMIAPLMLPIHILGELAKPISLSCRLFGNIFGEDMLLVAFVSLGITTLAFLPDWAPGLPLQLPFLLLALLTSTLQAAVFMVLSTIYFLLMLPHDDHGPEHGHETAPAHSH